MKNKKIKIALLQSNTGQLQGVPENPRFIHPDRRQKLKQSIIDDPEMLQLRELVVFPHNGAYVVVCGNQRLSVCEEMGYKEMECKVLPEDTTPEKLRAYVIKDNVSFGNDDTPKMSKWNKDDLTTWGVELPRAKAAPVENPVKTIFLTYPVDEAEKVKAQLSKIADTPKEAVTKLLQMWGEKPVKPV